MSLLDDHNSRSQVTQPGIDAAAAAVSWPDTEFAVTTRISAASRRRMRRRAAIGAAVLAMLLVAGVIVVITVVPRKTAAPASSSAPGLVESVLDGTYRMDFNRAERTVNGAAAPLPDTDHETQWAFRSTCTADGCAATGTALDDGVHQVLHFVDPHWNSLPVEIQADCDGHRGSQSELVSWSMEPQPDGTLNGLYRETVLTSECGLEGSVVETSFVATRLSDAPADVSIANPAAAPAPETVVPTGPDAAGPALIGTYRFAYDGASPRWWTFRSACNQSGCVAVGVALDGVDHEEPTERAAVLRFVAGRWQQGHPSRERSACGVVESTLSIDRALRGTDTTSVVSGDCGKPGDVVEHGFVATRDGAVPTDVVIADPAAFQ